MSNEEDKLRRALARLHKAIHGLAKTEGKVTLFEASPTKSQRAYDAWLELNGAQTQAAEALAATQEHRGEPGAAMQAALAAADRVSPDTAAAVAAERERCAKIADDRATGDRQLYQNETDWRMPYAFNRVVRASMDIAAAIRKDAVSSSKSDAQTEKERGSQ